MTRVSLGERYEQWVESLVDSGRYSTVSEVVRDSLRLLEERERARDAKLSDLRAAIAEGDASGETELLDMEAIKRDAHLARQLRNC